VPKPNYKYEKRQKEIAKQKKKEEKLKRKLERKMEDVQEIKKAEETEEKSGQPIPAAKEESDQE